MSRRLPRLPPAREARRDARRDPGARARLPRRARPLARAPRRSTTRCSPSSRAATRAPRSRPPTAMEGDESQGGRRDHRRAERPRAGPLHRARGLPRPGAGQRARGRPGAPHDARRPAALAGPPRGGARRPQGPLRARRAQRAPAAHAATPPRRRSSAGTRCSPPRPRSPSWAGSPRPRPPPRAAPPTSATSNRKAQDAAALAAYWKQLPVRAARRPGHRRHGGALPPRRSAARPRRRPSSRPRSTPGWDAGLVALYADCAGASALPLIERAEKWLRAHARDPALLLALGKLCMHQGAVGQGAELHRGEPRPRAHARGPHDARRADGEARQAAGSRPPFPPQRGTRGLSAASNPLIAVSRRPWP